MEIRFKVDDDIKKSFSEPALVRLNRVVKEYTLDIIKEAKNEQKIISNHGVKLEITESYIVDAVKNYKIKPRRSLISIILSILAEIGFFLLGVFFRPENFFIDKTLTKWFLIWIFGLVAVIICVVYRELNGGK